MKIEDVPQDDNPTFKGYGTKAVYAVDERGRYTKTATSGWDVEEVVLRDVLEDFDALAADAKRRVLQGKTSPIEFFLYRRLMDLPSLARSMGLWQWQVRRHLKPKVFKKLSVARLQQYADLFRIDLSALTHFKETTDIEPDS